jgi:FkbM family methyltransferase
MDRSAAAEKFDDIILWEQAIQVIAHDFIRAGDFILDVGGNVGGLSVAFARMTGPTGRVIVLECNAEILPVLKRTLELNRATQVEVIERAAYAKSNLTLSFEVDPSFYSSSSKLTTDAGAATMSVNTAALDDVIRDAGRDPAFIKIDVEGAEVDVLRGAARQLEANAPPIVFEYTYQPEDDRCALTLLEKYGYKFWDIYLYRPVSRAFYAEVGGMSNVLALPPQTQARGYSKSAAISHRSAETLLLPMGRSIVRVAVDGEPSVDARVTVHDVKGRLLSVVQTSVAAMQNHAHSTFVFQTDTPLAVAIEAEAVNGPRVSYRGATVSQVELLG